MKLLLPLLVIITAMAIIGSCADDTPAELSITSTRSGQQMGCRVLIWNSKNVQIRDEATDMQGIVFIQGILPGKYKLTFVDVKDNKYAAERWITLQPGDEMNVAVDLDVPTDPQYADPNAPASAPPPAS